MLRLPTGAAGMSIAARRLQRAGATVPSAGRFGIYDGIAYYDTTGTITQGVRRTQQVFANYPDVATDYHDSQPSQIAVLPTNFNALRTRMGFGVDCLVTWNTGLGSGVRSIGTKDIANANNAQGSGAYANWLTVKGHLQSLDAYAASVGRQVYFAFDHEGENYLWHSNSRSPDGGLDDPQAKYDQSVTINDWVRAVARTTKELKDLGLTNTKVVWWTSGWNMSATTGYNGEYSVLTAGNLLASVVANNPSWAAFPDVFGFDPYMRADTPTFISLVQPKINEVKAHPWYAAHPIPICIPEFGAGTRVGADPAARDAAMAAFYSNLRSQIQALELEFAVMFNRNDGAISANINETNYPNARAAIAASLER